MTDQDKSKTVEELLKGVLALPYTVPGSISLQSVIDLIQSDVDVTAMTLQECKGQIARYYGYPIWGNILNDLLEGNITPLQVNDYGDEAAELYASQLKKEGEQKELTELLAIINRDGGHYEQSNGTAKAVVDAQTIIYEKWEHKRN